MTSAPTWQAVGAGSATTGGISNNDGSSGVASLAIAPDGTPYVAWEDDTAGNFEIYVLRWNGGSWEPVGAGSASGGGISDNDGESAFPSLAFAPDGTPYVAWEDDTAGNFQIYVLRWNGSNWEPVGAGSASAGGVSDNAGTSQMPCVALDPSGDPYLAWHDQSSGDWEIYMKAWGY